MHAERSDEPKFELPQDLVAATRQADPRRDEFYRVEAFKPSFFGRIAEALTGGQKRR